jgi:hypothetical protein
MKDKALEALYEIRKLAVSTGDPSEILRKITVIAVDACDEVEGRVTSLADERKEE